MPNVHSVEDLKEGDILAVQKGCPDRLSGVSLRVSDSQVDDIGITETFAVTLVTDAEDEPNYVAKGTKSDSTLTLSAINEEWEREGLMWQQFTFEEKA